MAINLTDADVYREKKFFCKPDELSAKITELFAADAYSLTIEPLLEAHFTAAQGEAAVDETVSEYMITATFGAE